MKLRLIKFKKIKSTNDIAIKLIKKNETKPTLITSLAQTRGRGTMGKKWISQKGNLFLSIFFEINLKKISLKQFTLLNVYVLKKVIKFKINGLACNRANVLWRDMRRCQYCYKHHDDRELTLDHVIPKSRGGLNTWTNIVTACKDCNQKKGNKTPAEANMRLYRQPVKPKTSLLNYSKISNVNEIWKNYLWEFK